MSRIWMSIEPEFPETKIMMTMAGVGTLMRARFPVAPENPEALQLFLRGIAAWFGEPFCVVLDADSLVPIGATVFKFDFYSRAGRRPEINVVGLVLLSCLDADRAP